MLYYRNVAVIFCCYAAVAAECVECDPLPKIQPRCGLLPAATADPADPVNNTCRKRPLAANHQSNTF